MESVNTSGDPLRRALDTIRRLKAQLDDRGGHQPLAIVGVGLRFPGELDTLEGYWDALAEGRDLIRPMPAARKARFAAAWDGLPHRGGFLDDVTRFDAGFFGISPREARALDPQHRVLLEVAWEALENAALPPDRLHGLRAGLFVGITGQDYHDWQTGEPDVYWATGNGHCFAAGRAAYAMGFTGPAIAVDTACSSGLVAVHLAAQAIGRGECELALAAGVNLVLSPRSTRLLNETRTLAPDGRCRPFDARASGFARGEGCGVVVLKRLDRALRDGDRVHAVIHGSAVNHDGRASGFTAPNVLAQTAVIEAALADAELAPSAIGLVEAHGAGTALGDPIEIEAIAAALGRRNHGARLYVGSVKPNLGHLEAAAGIAGLLKAIACCVHRAIPGLVHYGTQNPRIDVTGTGITFPTKLVPWPSDSGRYAGVSSFGLSGTNAHVIVGAADPAAARPATAPAGFELAARTPEALRALAARFRECLAELSDDEYGAFAYTASWGRARHGARARIAAVDRAGALAALDAVARDLPSPAVTLGASAQPLDELPRAVVELPHYPWQRTDHAPPAPAAELVEHPPEPALDQASPASGGSPSLITALLALPAAARLGAARSHVRGHVAAILGHRDPGAVRDDANLFDLGFDSFMAVDLACALSTSSGTELSIAHVFTSATVEELAATIVGRLGAGAVATTPPRPRPVPREPRVAFVFSCQGSQYFGMGRELYDTEPVFRARIDACDRILSPTLGGSLTELMMHGDDPDAIHQTRVTQPALVALELALAELWRSRGVTPAVVMGHSVGEVAAAIHAGVMDLESGLAFIAHRGRLMQSTAPGAMLTVCAPPARVADWLAGTALDIAAINGPDTVVVAGARDEIEALARRVEAAGAIARPLRVSHASHSRLMEPVLGPLADALASLRCHAPRLPIIANRAGRLAGPAEYDARYWCDHLRGPVRFHDGALALRALDIDVCLEIGPDATLVKLIAAAGLLPAGGGLASLRRGADERDTFEAAALALRELGQPTVRGDLRSEPEPPRIGAPYVFTGARDGSAQTTGRATP
jgi:acyl transferase domain-containing protein